ncbi:MAG: hypothetical protein SVM79_08350, partial [Chloroflexota bacterium]|nr:hypothetical protein [Chloroflexota bacterium]
IQWRWAAWFNTNTVYGKSTYEALPPRQGKPGLNRAAFSKQVSFDENSQLDSPIQETGNLRRGTE